MAVVEAQISSQGSLTLAQRFHSLPPEVQDEIFAWLLVRPVRWDCEHKSDCPRRLSVNPYLDVRPWYDPFQHTCVANFGHAPSWRHNEKPIWADPWRSQWAPVPRNPYLCTMCYDHRHRPRPFPLMDSQSLPCLCARRDHLQILLVCRRWYQEAGRVFYSRNTFAFGRLKECHLFLTSLPEKWKPYITKISLMSLPRPGFHPEDAQQDLDTTVIPVHGTSGLFKTWLELRKLPALAVLELDAIMLTKPDVASVFRMPALKNLRSIRIVQALPASAREHQWLVWPRLAKRQDVLDSDFVRMMARGIKGHRYGWIRGAGTAFYDKVLEEKELYLTRFRSTPIKDDNGGSERNDDQASLGDESEIRD
jgi:hypothetical protein